MLAIYFQYFYSAWWCKARPISLSRVVWSCLFKGTEWSMKYGGLYFSLNKFISFSLSCSYCGCGLIVASWWGEWQLTDQTCSAAAPSAFCPIWWREHVTYIDHNLDDPLPIIIRYTTTGLIWIGKGSLVDFMSQFVSIFKNIYSLIFLFLFIFLIFKY